jgi:hypothetical protein
MAIKKSELCQMEYDSTVASVRAIAQTSYFTFLDRRGRPRPPTKSDFCQVFEYERGQQ